MGFGTQPELTDISRFDKAIRRENAFIATTGLTEVAASGGSVALTLENPAGAGVTAVVIGARVQTEFAADGELFDSFSSDPSGGTDVGIDNLLLDSGGGTDPGSLTARQGDTFTADNTQDAFVLGGGQGGQATGASQGTNKFYLEPGRHVVLQINNRSSNQGTAVIDYVWFELEEVLIGS